MSVKRTASYSSTVRACYIGYVTQALIVNFAPLLFLTFQSSFGLSIEKITLLTTANFLIQLCADFASAKIIGLMGFRGAAAAAHALSAAGLIGIAFMPSVIDPFAGLLVSTVLYACGGGLIEVVINPIIEACPSSNKAASMSLLHSFYCWGQVSVVLLSTLFFTLFGVENWRILACLWAIIPLLNMFNFLRVPIMNAEQGGSGAALGQLLRSKLFWLLLIMIMSAGAAEQAMSQWSSAFAESGLRVSKTVGDLAGPCAFAVLMGTARVLHSRISARVNLIAVMSASSLLCAAAYLAATLTGIALLGLVGCAICGFAVGILWPGTLSLASKHIAGGGTVMFALLAIAGDVGCTAGPTLVGFMSDLTGGLRGGLLCAVIFPVLTLISLTLFGKSVGAKKNRL